MVATQLTNTGWEKDGVVLGEWSNRRDIVLDFLLCSSKSPVLAPAAKTKTQAEPSSDCVNEFKTPSRTRSFT